MIYLFKLFENNRILEKMFYDLKDPSLRIMFFLVFILKYIELNMIRDMVDWNALRYQKYISVKENITY